MLDQAIHHFTKHVRGCRITQIVEASRLFYDIQTPVMPSFFVYRIAINKATLEAEAIFSEEEYGIFHWIKLGSIEEMPVEQILDTYQRHVYYIPKYLMEDMIDSNWRSLSRDDISFHIEDQIGFDGFVNRAMIQSAMDYEEGDPYILALWRQAMNEHIKPFEGLENLSHGMYHGASDSTRREVRIASDLSYTNGQVVPLLSRYLSSSDRLITHDSNGFKYLAPFMGVYREQFLQHIPTVAIRTIKEQNLVAYDSIFDPLFGVTICSIDALFGFQDRTQYSIEHESGSLNDDEVPATVGLLYHSTNKWHLVFRIDTSRFSGELPSFLADQPHVYAPVLHAMLHHTDHVPVDLWPALLEQDYV